MRDRSRTWPRSVRWGAWALAFVAFALAAHADTKRWFEGSDKVFIRQHDQFVRISEPDAHMARAHRSYAKGNRSSAADELEKAAAGFAYFAERSAGTDRDDLQVAERALDALADQLRRGEVEEITTLDRAIEDAQRVLARVPAKPAQPAPPHAAPK